MPSTTCLPLTPSVKVSLASNLLALGAIALAWYGVPAAPPLPYTFHKFMHILGVVVFMGNMVTGPLWLMLAYYAGEPRQLALSAQALAKADMYLTAPGVQLAVWNGICMVGALGGVHKHPWLLEALGLLVATSVFSCTVVLYWQERFVAAAVAEDAVDTRRALVQWALWGTLVGVPFVWVAWLMVDKQALLVGQ